MTFLSIDANNKLYEAKLNAENNNKNVSEINKTISDNSIFATNSLQYDLSVDNTNSINQNLFIPDDEIVDSFEYQTSDINANARELYDELEQTREDQGIIGKLWDGFKNLTGLGAGSNKAEDAIKQYENGEISLEEAKEKLNGYQQGQETCVDVVGDIVSGIVAVGAFALAVPTGGTSLIAGLGLAAAAGAGSKIAVKAGDAITGGREYSGKDLLYDSATGAVNGLFAPVTNGVGACVTKTVGKKLGLTVVKEGTKEAIEQGAKQGLKSIITQQGVDVIGGTFAKRALATASGMAIDGAIGGSTDNMIRAALDGEDAKGIFEAGVQGLAGGLIMSPVIGGGFKVAGKLGKNLNNKITTKALFKDGMNTTFKQGQTGDCALLSFLSGAMNNRETQDTIKKSITKSIGGDYHIRIGNQTIDIPKSALTDEMLSDTTGIKLFEAAYKKAGGSIDGEFADSVARQFGFNPVHITGDLITDETLDKIAKEQGTILSFGTKIDADGNVSLEGANHYFSIKNVDTNKKILTLSDPYDTSKTIELSYDDAKKFGISIDGGSIKETDLPNSARRLNEPKFQGSKINGEILIDNLEKYDFDNAAKITDFSDSTILSVGGTEISLGKYRKIIKQLNGNPDECISIGSVKNIKNRQYGGLKSGQEVLIFGDGKIVNVSDCDAGVYVYKKSVQIPSVADISAYRGDDKTILQNILSLKQLPREEKIKMLDELTANFKYPMHATYANLSDSELDIILCAHEISPSIKRYKCDAKEGFKKINKALETLANGGEVSESGVIKDINSITETIERHIIPDGTKLYRMEGYEALGALGKVLRQLDENYAETGDFSQIRAFLESRLKSPEVYSFRQSHFLSTNMGDYVKNIDGPVKLEITTANNARGIFILDDNRYNMTEFEILLQRNSALTGSINYDFDAKKWVISCVVEN